MLSTALFLVLAFSVSTTLGQCSLAGYIGAYDPTSGAFIGAVARNLGSQGILSGYSTPILGDHSWTLARRAALEQTGNRANYLAVLGSSSNTTTGEAVLLQILSPIDPNAPFVSLVMGNQILDCNAIAIPNGDAAWAAQITPSDGDPRGPFPLPADSRTTLLGGYGNLQTFCGEPMAWAIRSNLGRDTLAPVWTDQNGNQHSVAVIHDTTNNRIAISPSLAAYTAAAHGTFPTISEVCYSPSMDIFNWVLVTIDYTDRSNVRISHVVQLPPAQSSRPPALFHQPPIHGALFQVESARRLLDMERHGWRGKSGNLARLKVSAAWSAEDCGSPRAILTNLTPNSSAERREDVTESIERDQRHKYLSP
ncbi:hypothetical protein B0H13DRAFT_1902081 [Mycena leptocephala]|nr:hypothetical protein B0H13DRAFT_1902081 [Mycena leptocephala]